MHSLPLGVRGLADVSPPAFVEEPVVMAEPGAEDECHVRLGVFDVYATQPRAFMARPACQIFVMCRIRPSSLNSITYT